MSVDKLSVKGLFGNDDSGKVERNLMSFLPELKVVDCTLRDGGLTNDFFFTDEFARALYQANIKAGVDYMEFGYRASKEMFDESKFGKWKFSSDEDIRDIIQADKAEGIKLSIMADVGRCDYQTDIHDRADSPVDLVRVATYINTIPAAVAMIEDAHAKGYETSCNIMAISKSTNEDIRTAVEQVCRSNVDMIYVVDSYGSLYPEQVNPLCQAYVEIAEKYGKTVGIHAHNNQQLAFANTIEAMRAGVHYLDATVSSLGRGAGNCPLEILLGFLKNPKYHIDPILIFIEKHIIALRESGVKWGYDIPYLLTGILNQHPRSAIQCIEAGRTDYEQFYIELSDNF
ncbi:MAG: aldolase catalytic domain-containing protein [Lachnospiraceae bacterium]|nr:aldolase catalytic domain-containing protein [Lachnospiraceae bacterium]